MSPESQTVLIVGTGSIGERHLRCFLATERCQVGFVEVREELRRQVAGRYPDSTAFPSLESAVRQQWTAAVIATPAPLHIPQAIELANRNMHLLIEKPLSIGLDRVEELASAVLEQKRTAAVAYVYRAHPVLAEMRQALLSGAYGKPLQLVATCGQHFPTYRPAYQQTYYVDRRSGGGAVQDAITHIINIGEWLLGPVERLVADLAHQKLPGVTVEDTVHVLARHGSAMANYALNQHQAPNEITITVACERGTLRFENHLNRWRVMELPETPWTDSPPVTFERDLLYVRQAQAFLDAIAGKSAPLCSLEEGISTLRANLAILQSAESRQWQSTCGGEN